MWNLNMPSTHPMPVVSTLDDKRDIKQQEAFLHGSLDCGIQQWNTVYAVQYIPVVPLSIKLAKSVGLGGPVYNLMRSVFSLARRIRVSAACAAKGTWNEKRRCYTISFLVEHSSIVYLKCRAAQHFCVV